MPHARRSARRRRQGHNDVLLIIDNYDSFTYNIVQYVGELGAEPVVHRNDTLSVSAVLELAPDAIIISPGPCTPSEAGISVPLVRAAAEAGVPLLGVCLGHQAIGEALARNRLAISNVNAFMMHAVNDHRQKYWHPSWIEPDASYRRVRIDHTKRALTLAKELGATCITTEPGGPVEGRP